MKDIDIYIFGISNDLYEKIFPEKKENITKDFGTIQKRIFQKKRKFSKMIFSKKKDECKWNGLKYPILDEKNKSEIIKDTYEDIKNSSNKNRIILKFGASFIKEFSFLINKLEKDKPFILFILNEKEIEGNTFNKYKNPEYLSYINDSEPDKIYLKIISFLWEKDCYFNERGNELSRFLPSNILYHSPRGFLFCNILLTGESRAGKSSFLNKIFGKLISYESGQLESTTKEIHHYELYPPEDENLKDNLKHGYGGIKIFDTPGLVKTKELNSFKLIKSELDNIFEQIHFVFFFIKAQSNIEDCIDMLEYIRDKNKDRKKKKIYPIPVLFIKNGEDLISKDKPVFFDYLKKALSENNLLELYDSSINENNKKIEENEDDFFKDEEDLVNNYENYVDGNIIQIHIPTGKNINVVFSTINKYLLKYNKLIIQNDKMEKEFSKMENNCKKLISYYIKTKIKNKSLSNEEKNEVSLLYDKCNQFVQSVKEKCSILYNLNILELKEKWKKNLYSVLIWLTAPLLIFYLPLVLIPESYYRASLIDVLAINYGFDEKDMKKYGLDEYIYEKSEKFEDEKIKQKFEDIIYYIGPIQCALKAKELFIQIFDLFEKLSEKKENEWNTFKIEQI